MLEGIKAVIFDLDGTLVDSMWMWKDIDREYLAKYGFELPDDLQKEIEGMSFSETAVYFKERFDIPDSLDKMKDDWNQMAWDKYANEVHLKKGVQAFLDELRYRNIRIGVATSNSRQLAELVMRSNNIRRYFDSIRTSCEVASGKPAPDIYLKVASDLGVNTDECLVFEDVVNGIVAGKSANMRVCAVHDDYSEDSDEAKAKRADFFINSFMDICKSKSTIVVK